MHVLRTNQMHRDARSVDLMEAARWRQVGQFLDKWGENLRLLIHRCIKSVHAGGSPVLKAAATYPREIRLISLIFPSPADETETFHATADNSDNDTASMCVFLRWLKYILALLFYVESLKSDLHWYFHRNHFCPWYYVVETLAFAERMQTLLQCRMTQMCGRSELSIKRGLKAITTPHFA